MIHSFEGDALLLPADRPKRVQGHVRVDGIGGRLLGGGVLLDVKHTDPTDLVVSVKTPAGHEARLVNRNMHPSGRYALPDTMLGDDPNGHWTLFVDDLVAGDGGAVAWRIELETTAGSFYIELELDDTLKSTLAYRAAFEHAAARWSGAIVKALTPATLPGGRRVDNLLIFGRAAPIDGVGRILGQAGPTHIRDDGLLPIAGSMRFDVADLAAMADDGSILDVIVHEMAHVLGFGTLWRLWGLLTGAGTANPLFTGEAAIQEYSALRALGGQVPVENVGGAGTRDAHWRESVFHNLLMTGYLDPGFNPLSRMTLASFEDAGYAVDRGAADLVGTFRRVGSDGKRRTCSCTDFRPVRVREAA